MKSLKVTISQSDNDNPHIDGLSKRAMKDTNLRRLALGQTDDVMSDDEMYPYTAEGRNVLGNSSPQDREIARGQS